MSNFNFGKEAALNELAEMIDDGATMQDVMEVIEGTLGNQEKVASEEDMDFRLGLEAVCHDFLAKTASLYGEYDASELDENEQAFVVFEKVAEGMADKARAAAKKVKDSAGRAAGAASNVAQAPVRGLAWGVANGKGGTRDRLASGMNAHSGKATAGLAAAGLLGAGAYGVNKLRKKRQEEREKKASFNDQDVESAIDILKQAGLLED